MILANHGIVSSSGASFDADALAFITAASITDNTQKTAVNTLVTDLKAYNIWTKMKAIYPFVGGSATSHKFNLKDPRDLDAAFRLVFSGGWTHSSSGALPNGSNAYANTFLNPSVNFTQNSFSGGYYSNTNPTFGVNLIRTDVFYGVSDSSFNNAIYLLPIASGDSYDYSRCNVSSVTGVSVWTDPKGFFQMSRTTSSNFFTKRNNVTNIFNTSSVTPTNNNLWIAALNKGGTWAEGSNNQSAFVYFGDGLTDSESNNFYTSVQAYQTILSRNV